MDKMNKKNFLVNGVEMVVMKDRILTYIDSFALAA